MMQTLFAALFALLLLLSPQTGWAQEVGSIVEAVGDVEVARSGAWSVADVGFAVQQGDEIRTGEPGKARVLFLDESVLVLGDASHMKIDEYVYNPNEGTGTSLMRLLRGKVRSLVSEYYGGPRASYQLETKTAVAGVRGTEFVVSYDEETDTTKVLGISGVVAVHSIFDRLSNGVIITSSEVTYVTEGELPTPPRRIEDEMFRQFLDDVNFSGLAASMAASMIGSAPVVTGDSVAEPDRAPAQAQVSAPSDVGTTPTFGDLVDQPPGVLEVQRGRLGIRF